MPIVTIFFGGVLILLGCVGYFGSGSANPSVTALIPAFLGVPLELCGVAALNPKFRMHAMHGAVLLGLIGAIAALGRGLMKIGALASDDPTVDKRPVVLVLTMAALCIVYVALCIRSFIAARKRRQAAG
jgi:hypothetical protein